MVFLYESVADQLQQAIEQGLYRPGERLPGIRKLSAQRRVSAATVIAALHRLEDRGYLEARHRSGYYVRIRPRQQFEEPATSAPSGKPSPVSGQSLVLRLSKATNTAGIVQLGAAVPAASFLPTPLLERALVQAVRRHRSRGASYEFPPGCPELRRQIARRMTEHGCRIGPEQIVITNGCQEAITFALRAVTRPGDIVAIESPTFYGLLQVIESLALKAIEIPTHPQTGISLEALQLACEQWPVKACIVVPNFSNPLGYCMRDADKRDLVLLAARYDIAIIEDDVYGDLGFAMHRPSVLKSWDEDGRILHCASFSKSLSPGLRIGWIVPGRYREQIEYLKFVTNLAASGFAQLAVAELLQGGAYQRYLRQVCDRYAQAIERMTEAIQLHFPAQTRITRPAGGFVLWVELPPAVDAVKLTQQALAQGISIAPGPVFSATGKYRNYIRLNCACDWHTGVERALAVLGKLIA